MRIIKVEVRYALRTGTRGTLHVLAGSTAEAIMHVMDVYGLALRACSARSSTPWQATGAAS
jgi:hypothetical protein